MRAKSPWRRQLPTVGDNLPPITKQLTQAKIDRYADASGDQNPLHTNPAVAAIGPFGGTIAHGMLILAFVSQMMETSFGNAWCGELDVRFRAPARPGDKVTAAGRVIRTDGEKVVCEVECRSQNGEVLISGEASVRVS